MTAVILDARLEAQYSSGLVLLGTRSIACNFRFRVRAREL